MFSNTLDILEDLKKGKIICIADSEDIENEIDMMCLGKYATPGNVNFMITNAKGLVCVPMGYDYATSHGFKKMDIKGFSEDVRQTPFCQPVDLKACLTGISATERSMTIRHLANKDNKPDDFISFGHVFTLIARKGLLEERQGHTEASVFLASLVDKNSPVATICEIIKDNGEMLRVGDFEEWNKNKHLKICHIDNLVTSYKYLEV